jgi:hypothetical protein
MLSSAGRLRVQNIRPLSCVFRIAAKNSWCPEPTVSRHWPTKNMLRQMVEEVGTATI